MYLKVFIFIKVYVMYYVLLINYHLDQVVIFVVRIVNVHHVHAIFYPRPGAAWREARLPYPQIVA